MNHLQLIALLSSFLIGIPLSSLAASGARDTDSHDEQRLEENAELPLVSGEIHRVDHESGMITIKHAPIPNFGMPAMTMPFKADDMAMLTQFKVGDKVKFSVSKLNNALTIVRLEQV